MNGIIKGNTGDWEMVIGLEVHAQIASESKLFSGAPNDFGAEPNQNVSFVDAGFPGMLPVINAKCVEQAVRTGLGLQAQINQHSVFDRKNYFYPDLPSGYQISQFLDPVVGKGVLHVELEDGSIKDVGITRLHLEQDAGKSLHEHSPTMSFIDLNRAGIALMEIVSEPDLRTPEEAGAYLKKLRAILRYLGTCGGDMDKGEMRCDANVSVRPVGSTTLGTRCEIKNVNSVRFLMRAIQFEAERQVQILESGGKIDQETRLYDSVAHETRTMRTKEDAHDYRYFPDPDLLPLVLSDAFVANIKASLPELPDEKKARYMRDFGLTPYDASVIVSDKAAAEYYETVLAALTSPSRGEVG
ncbi:MAG: Asp-tRNA(Asn)/Glu-tRNA(Gln) amidotransferase subunit GatB, partial [Rickettsiales bacterium]|nr:Asp-tRNA(Asn)/Glu-tRNA(Gln) amidotransferase subunit GatB [Rickettsiales bacterium]